MNPASVGYGLELINPTTERNYNAYNQDRENRLRYLDRA
jgi:hypothetical protein